MNINNILLYVSFFLAMVSCDNRPSQQQIAENKSPSLSNAYKPPRFVGDNRVESIKEIAPTIHQLIEKHTRVKNIPGFAYGVVVDDKLILASAGGLINLEKKLPATTKSCFRMASMTKSFTAMAILKLRDEGKLSLADPVAEYIPEMSGLEFLTSDAPAINIENLLTMTAGFPEDNPWGDRQLDESDQMLLDLTAEGLSFSSPTSTQYEYSNTGYALLGNIISRVSGKPYQEYINESLLQPLGMDHTYWEYESIPEDQLAIGYHWEDGQWQREPMLHDGSFGAMGGLITSVEDFCKYVSFHLSAWPPRSEQDKGPLKRSTLREMQTPQFARLDKDSRDWNDDPCVAISGYGFGLRTSQDCNGIRSVSHGGALPGFASQYVFFPDHGVGFMAFGNLTYTSPWSFQEIEKLLFETIDLQARELPASDILMVRQEQVVQLIQNWDTGLEAEILAENFYLDKSREHRMAEAKEMMDKAGAILSMEEIKPLNQLRGTFNLKAENGIIEILFTLTPEKNPRIQRLNMSFKAN
jgi:CubicO group peptidase (beta-lactamase class C family)